MVIMPEPTFYSLRKIVIAGILFAEVTLAFQES